MLTRRLVLVSLVWCIAAGAAGDSTTRLDTAKIDSALGRSGAWVNGAYLVDFFRSNLVVTVEGVQLVSGHVESKATFVGTDDDTEMMGDLCALPGELTEAIERLRSSDIQVTGIHNHFLGESPRLTFIHFMGRGRAADLARAFRAALAATATPLGEVAAPRMSAPPDWAKAIQTTLGRQGSYSADYGFLTVKFPRAEFPAGPTDFWNASGLFFQQAPSGRIAATGDLAVTARELNPALSLLTAHHFEILGVHNHMIDEQPRRDRVGSPRGGIGRSHARAQVNSDSIPRRNRKTENPNQLADWVYREYDALPASDLRKKVEELLPRFVFRIKQALAITCFLILDDFRSRIYPIADHLTSHIARSNSDP